LKGGYFIATVFKSEYILTNLRHPPMRIISDLAQKTRLSMLDYTARPPYDNRQSDI